MNLKLKIIEKKPCIVDVKAEINEGNLILDTFQNACPFVRKVETVEECWKQTTEHKVIATPEQIDIDNLWEKYLEALAEKESYKYVTEVSRVNNTCDLNDRSIGFEEGYIQAKKETCFSESDIIEAIEYGIINGNTTDVFIHQLKLSKIPECGVELGMFWLGNKNKKTPKIYEGKVNILNLIL